VTQIVRSSRISGSQLEIPLAINADGTTTFISGYDGETELTGTALLGLIDGGDGTGYVVFDSSAISTGGTLAFLDRETGDYYGDIEASLGGDGKKTIIMFSPQSILLTAGDNTEPALVRDIVIQYDGAVRICIDGVEEEYDLMRFNPDSSLVIQPTKIAFFNNTPVDQPATIADPSGGTVIDAQARTAIVALLNAFRQSTGGNGLIA
jgi:hypothetical protein